MIRIGLTGAIGSGKSTLARKAAADLSIPVFDADQAVHDLYASDIQLHKFLVEKCGKKVLKDGAVDRGVLKAFMLNPDNKTEWQEIEATVRHRVWDVYQEFSKKHEAEGADYIIADVPFLFEDGAEPHFDYTINVFLPYEQQKARALSRQTPKLSEADFEKRYAAFLPMEQRNRRADFTIDNSGEVDASFLQFRAHLKNMKDAQKPASLSQSFNDAVVYVGSFDPMTLGHVDVIRNAIKMPYKNIYVAVGVNPAKKPMFTTEERLKMIEREMDRDIRPHLAPGQKIIVTSYEGMTVDFMKKVGASMCIRGLRGINDMEEEGNLAAVNRGLFADALDEPGSAEFSQVYFAASNPDLRHVSSSFARAICTGKRDLSLLRYVSSDVAAKMIAKRDRKKDGQIDNVYRTPTHAELENLKSLWDQYVPQNAKTDHIFKDLLAKYSEPHRAYHNVGHLVEVFEAFKEYEDRWQDPQAVALAMFYHDAVYDVLRNDNEGQSAEYARQMLLDLKLSDEKINRICDMVKLTETHMVSKNDYDAALMLDIDMAVVGQSADKYQRYAKAVRAEYLTGFSADKYAEGRTAFLASVKSKSRIFITDEFENKFGQQAILNMAAEHRGLVAGRKPQAKATPKK